MSSDSTMPVDPQGQPTTPPPASMPFTRAGALWSALIAGFLVLIVLLVFITQNTGSVDLAFFAWTWILPKGVAILLAACLGANALVQRIETEAVDKFGGFADRPDGEVGVLASFQRAYAVELAERPGSLAGNPGDALLDGHRKQRRAHVHGQEQRGQR